MTQRRSRRRPPQAESTVERSATKPPRELAGKPQERPSHGWAEPHTSHQHSRSTLPSLTSLIERDAPLQAHSILVLMYGPFQAEMVPQEGQGVASWLRDCVHKHGLPSLVRFDYRRRAQIFRRDQFQPWLEPFLSQIPS